MGDAAAKQIRSPSYPSMPLREAVEAIGKIERLYRSSPVDRAAAAKLIGYSSLSGPANKALAALASYGLLGRAGKGEARVTDRARAILHASSEAERRQNLLDAALEPGLFREIRDRFPDVPVPPEAGVISHLHRKQFNSSAVKPAARAFLETAAYVEELNASESHGKQSPTGPISSASKEDTLTCEGAKPGDLVQWESQGVLQLETPLRVRAVSADGEWVFVEGSETGIPMDETIVEAAAPSPPTSSQRTPPVLPLKANEIEIKPTEKGEVEWMRNRVDRDTYVRILVKGDLGSKEIGKLITLLEAQKLVLEED